MMKSVLVASAFCLFGMTANAADIVLAAGAKAYIKAGEAAVVACEGTASNLPVCSVEKDTNSSYDAICSGGDRLKVMIGSKRINCSQTMDEAIAYIEKLRKSGLCL